MAAAAGAFVGLIYGWFSYEEIPDNVVPLPNLAA